MFNLFKWFGFDEEPKEQKYIDSKKVESVQEVVSILVDIGLFKRYMKVSPKLEEKYSHLLKEENEV